MIPIFARIAPSTSLGLALTLLAVPTAFAQIGGQPAIAQSPGVNGAANYESLAAQEFERAGEVAFDTAFGQAAFEAGHYTRAILAWERVLTLHPNDTNAQLALGRALMASGDKAGALAISDWVRQNAALPTAALTMDRFFTSFDRGDHNGLATIKAHIEATIGHDSNANAGPPTSGLTGTLPGTLTQWRLAPAAVGTSASFVGAAASLTGRWVWDPTWSAAGTVTGSRRDLGSAARAFESAQVDGQLGVAYQRERHDVMLSALTSETDQNHASARRSNGVNLDWVFRLDGFQQWAGFVQRLNLSYPGQAMRDVERTVGGVTYVRMLRAGHSVYAGIYGGKEAAKGGRAHFGHDLTGLRVGGQYAFTPQWSAFTSLLYEKRAYGATDPFFGVVRQDQQTDFALGIAWVPRAAWRLTGQVNATNNPSNLLVSDYKRRQYSLTLRREF